MNAARLTISARTVERLRTRLEHSVCRHCSSAFEVDRVVPFKAEQSQVVSAGRYLRLYQYDCPCGASYLFGYFGARWHWSMQRVFDFKGQRWSCSYSFDEDCTGFSPIDSRGCPVQEREKVSGYVPPERFTKLLPFV
jgi:hypothetical protein